MPDVMVVGSMDGRGGCCTSTILRRPKRVWLLITVSRLKLLSALLVGLLLIPLAASGEMISAAVHECQGCHTGMSHPAVKRATLEGCISCHAENEVRLGRGHTDDQWPLPTHGTVVNEGEKFVAGMHVPMRYDGTRIGRRPNEMVLIPAGAFIMGSDERLPDEGPAHQVTLSNYWLDRYEVTNAQYKQFIDATNRKSPRHFENRTFPKQMADHPVVYVSWYDARDYCEWSGKRLPTEAEWEKGARGSDGRRYPWGDKFEMTRANMPQRWNTLKQAGSTTPVGAFESGVSPFGLYDMSGNVWEWTSSWYKAHPGNKKLTENYGETYKVLKGGSWWNCSFYRCGASAPAFNRSFFLRSTRNKSFGFRCANSVEGG